MKNLRVQSTANPNQVVVKHGKGGFDPRKKAVFNSKTGEYNIPLTNKMKADRSLIQEAENIIDMRSKKISAGKG